MKALFGAADGCDLYRSIRSHALYAQQKAELEQLWQQVHDIVDGPFLVEFRQTAAKLHQRFLEMYTGASLREVFGKSTVQGGGPGAPDFTVEVGNKRIHFECVSPEPGSGPDAPEAIDGLGTYDPYDGPDLRFEKALRTKCEAFARYRRAGVVGAMDPCVIVVSGRLIDLAQVELGLPRIARLAFGIGALAWTVTPSAASADRPVWKRRASFRTSSGRDVHTALFLQNDDMVQVSATMECNTGWECLPDLHGSDFAVVLNPRATSALSSGWFRRGQQVRIDEHGWLVHEAL